MWNKRSWKKQINSGRALEQYQSEAVKYMENPTLLSRMLDRAQQYLGETIARRVSGIAALIKDVPLMIRLVRAWLSGAYHNMSYKNMIIVVAGLLYFLSPIDLVPDFLGVFGFLDDVAILGFILSRMQAEIAEFRHWERTKG